MTYTRESLIGLGLITGSVFLTHAAGVIGIATSLLIFGYWALKFGGAWKEFWSQRKHRKYQDD